MQRIVLPLGLICASGLGFVCYGRVLFHGEQFAYRDAGSFYYPLYQRVQQEWSVGRWPLWDPWQNGGQPLLGNPMAAVLYPGKLVFACAPYPWAARLYVVGHTVLALAGMFALARGWGASTAAACLGALSYGFGAPVLFQYSNVIYLVGAAWTPWGLLALEGLVRQRRRGAACAFATVAALQVLGGDPEAAYLLAVCGLGYAVLLRIQENPRSATALARVLAPGAVAVWVVVPLGLALAHRSADDLPPQALSAVRLLGWAAAGASVLARRGRSLADRLLSTRLAGLAGALALAALLAAAQLVPTLEFSARSVRAAGNIRFNTYWFSVEPYRALEVFWPNVFGAMVPENRSWLQAIPPAGDRQFWEPSLYVGGLTVLLAAAGFGVRGATPWRAGLTVLLAVVLLGALGRFGGPLWWARWVPAASTWLGPHDPEHGRPRTDAFPADGTASPYALLAAALPGFETFRYPAKLLTLASAALSGLAAVGWDRLRTGNVRRLSIGAAALAGTSGLACALAWLGRETAVTRLSGRTPSQPIFGPLDAAGGWAETERALLHGGLVFLAGSTLARLAPRRPAVAAGLALVVMSVDLALANSRLVWTVPQSVFNARPEALRRIEEAASESRTPSDGPAPVRVHRLNEWYPGDFSERRALDRLRTQVAWDRDTLKSEYALPYGLAYTVTQGTLELNEYLILFAPGVFPVSSTVATQLGLAAGDPILYLPRRSFDLWGTRYFLTPSRPDGWKSRERGFASLLPETERIAPDPATAVDRAWSERQDWQLLRNDAAFPRAWLVHYARVSPPADGPARQALERNLLYQADAFWNEPDRSVYDLRTMAFVETADRESLKGYISRAPVQLDEAVEITHYDPQKVILRASLDRAGLVILADTYYPGWTLRIDGRPAPIYRANRLMRAAAVPAGTHLLEYRYRPASFAIGLGATVLGLAALALLGARAWLKKKGSGTNSTIGS